MAIHYVDLHHVTVMDTRWLHEYKGKFNPQIAKAILNIFGVRAGDNVLDPFCGSGTTLVECAQIGARATGIDLNPLAVFIANAKLKTLATPSKELNDDFKKLARGLKRLQKWTLKDTGDPRVQYLAKWFDADILCVIETIRRQIIAHADEMAPFFCVSPVTCFGIIRSRTRMTCVSAGVPRPCRRRPLSRPFSMPVSVL